MRNQNFGYGHINAGNTNLMINHPKVAVVILNWNGKFHLESFLPSVYNSIYPNLEFIIGDNASTDGSIEFIKTTYPLIRIIENDKNYGFAEGYNRVLSKVEADYFILLNSDVEVKENWIEPVIRDMESDPTIAAAQPKILSWAQRDSFEHAGAAGGFIDKYAYPFCRGRIFAHVETDHHQYNESGEIFWASGAAFFIRSKSWKESGGFDGDFFAHMEEIDLCWRLKRMGHKIWYCSDSEVSHVGGGTLDKTNPMKTFLNFRNNLYMIQKNSAKPYTLIFIRLWLDLVALLMFVFTGKFKDARAINKAHVQFFTNFNKTKRQREAINSPYEVNGVYKGSVVWESMVLGKKKFTELNTKKFG